MDLSWNGPNSLADCQSQQEACVVPMATVVVVGGGVSGLSAAYYLQRNATNIAKIILLEGTRRTGGWIHSVLHNDGSIFELGPRSLRPVGKSGKNTLHLAEELGLAKDILVVHRSDPAAKNRFLFVKGKLCPLPNSFGGIMKTKPPFSQPLMKNFVAEPFAKRSTASDETIHSFLGRRLGTEFADIAVDALCRGIFANDCRQLSMRSCFPDMFNLERQHGSLFFGMIKTRGPKTEAKSSLETQAQTEKWASWSLKRGMQQLSDGLEKAVAASALCEVIKGTPCVSIQPTHNGKVMVKAGGEEIVADHVISAVYSKDLACVLPNEMESLKLLLSSIPSASVYVVNLEYPGNQLPVDGFGHLLPSFENPYILGVVYDSCTFPDHNRKDVPSTRLTVMLGGGWLDHMLDKCGNLPPDATVATLAQMAVCKQLGVSSDLEPSKIKVTFQKECIPAYTLGHHERVSHIEKLVRDGHLPLTLIGASYKGVSINDCIFNTRLEMEHLLKLLKK